MNAVTKPIRPTNAQYLGMAVAVLAACLLLFSLDKDTHSFRDLWQPGDIVALAIYFLPTYMLCCALLDLLTRRRVKDSMALAMAIGIPTGFIAVILFFVLLR